jgi:hypothetical protein
MKKALLPLLTAWMLLCSCSEEKSISDGSDKTIRHIPFSSNYIITKDSTVIIFDRKNLKESIVIINTKKGEIVHPTK